MHQYSTPIRIWLFIGIVMVFVQILLGGITRLTGSGLSITEWKVIIGAIPPVNKTEWNEAFDQYKQFPQYEKINADMSLSEFKWIFFWEYLHRNWARLIGVVFLLPFIWFLIRKKIDRKLFPKLMIVFVLGALQGLVGWIMVKSGLIDKPWVDHYRLTIHFLLALLVLGYLQWLFLETETRIGDWGLRIREKKIIPVFWILSAVILLQLIYGGFMAGTHAGYLYHSWPMMNGKIIPESLSHNFSLQNITSDQTHIHFIHRWLAAMVAAFCFIFYWRSRKSEIQSIRKGSFALIAIVVLQFTLGVLTLIFSPVGKVDVVLGVCHQGGAVLLLCTVVYLAFHLFSKNSHSEFSAT